MDTNTLAKNTPVPRNTPETTPDRGITPVPRSPIYIGAGCRVQGDDQGTDSPRQLSPNLSANGYVGRQLKRVGDVALYTVETKTGRCLGYEVGLIRIAPAVEFAGKALPAREVWPKNEDFGQLAWYFMGCNRATAESFFDHMVATVPKPQSAA